MTEAPFKTKKESKTPRKNDEKLALQLAGLIDVVLNATRNFRQNHGSNQAAAMAFFALLSLIPLLLLTLILINYFFGSYPQTQELLFEAISEYHPYLSDKILSQLDKIEEKKRLLGWLGILGLFWVASMVIRAMEKSLSMIFRAEGRRNFLASTALVLSGMTLLWVATLLMIAANYSRELLDLEHPLGRIIFGGLSPQLWVFAGNALPKLMTVFVVALCYKFIPKSRITMTSALAGGVMFTLLMALAKVVFSWYLSSQARYGLIYGSLDVLIIIIIWTFYLSLIFLFCAEILSSYLRRDSLLVERVMLGKEGKLRRIDERLFQKFGRVYQAGEYIFQEGDSGQEMYYLIRGRVSLEKRSGTGVKELAQMTDGDYFGEMALLVETRRTASARVLETSFVAEIKRETFKRMLRENEEVGLLMLREFSHRLKKTGELLEKISHSSLLMTVIVYLLLKEDRLPGEIPELTFDLARITGKEEVEIAGILDILEREGILKLAPAGKPSLDKLQAWNLLLKSR